MIRGVIFDMDGVLVESEPLWAEADRQFAKHHGINIDEAFIATFKGRSQRDIVEDYRTKYNLQGDTAQLIRERTDIVVKILEMRAQLVKGIRELLDTLRYNSKQPVRLAVASSSPHDVIEFIVDKFDLWDYFELMTSGEDVLHGKPAPDIYFRTAERLELSVVDCLVVEDSASGIIAAKAANMKCIALAKDYVKEEDSSKADVVVKSLKEITPRLIASL